MAENTGWKEIAECSIAGYDARVFANPDDFILIAMYEQGKNSGVAFEVNKVFSSPEDFAAALKEVGDRQVEIYFLSSSSEPDYEIGDYSDKIRNTNPSLIPPLIESVSIDLNI